MGMIITLLFLIVIAFLIIYLRKKPNKKTKHIKHGKYHCVTVQFPKQACSAVKKLKDKRILSAEAPVLPLAACDAATCSCRFHHYEERRVEERRDIYHKTFDELAENTIEMIPRTTADRRKQ